MPVSITAEPLRLLPQVRTPMSIIRILGDTGKTGRRVAAPPAARETAATGVWHG
ncbi:MAG: hypothetical protein H0V41_17925 [Pseudonocardiales bacterium]|nr:hypothetical protein [Pseudonocardiales bacterium]